MTKFVVVRDSVVQGRILYRRDDDTFSIKCDKKVKKYVHRSEAHKDADRLNTMLFNKGLIGHKRFHVVSIEA